MEPKNCFSGGQVIGSEAFCLLASGCFTRSPFSDHVACQPSDFANDQPRGGLPAIRQLTSARFTPHARSPRSPLAVQCNAAVGLCTSRMHDAGSKLRQNRRSLCLETLGVHVSTLQIVILAGCCVGGWQTIIGHGSPAESGGLLSCAVCTCTLLVFWPWPWPWVRLDGWTRESESHCHPKNLRVVKYLGQRASVKQ
jgi:hypothetical protein